MRLGDTLLPPFWWKKRIRSAVHEKGYSHIFISTPKLQSLWPKIFSPHKQWHQQRFDIPNYRVDTYMRKLICRFTKVLLFPAIPLVWSELVLIGLLLEVGHTRRHHINMFMASYHFLADHGEGTGWFFLLVPPKMCKYGTSLSQGQHYNASAYLYHLIINPNHSTVNQWLKIRSYIYEQEN